MELTMVDWMVDRKAAKWVEMMAALMAQSLVDRRVEKTVVL